MSSIPFPLEIVIEATPISAQGSRSSQEAWRRVVAEHTRKRLHEVTDWYWLDERRIGVTIFYFPDSPMSGDVDNIVKPILDGMEAIAYLNDHTVERVLVQRFEPGLPWSFATPSSQLGIALDAAPPVLYIRVDDDLGWRSVP